MKPYKFQHASLWLLQQLSLILMVSMPWIIALDDAEGDKTFNLKIGFDLTPGLQGASALRIRNFEDDETVPKYYHRSLRAASGDSSNSNENDKKKVPKIAVEMKAADDSSLSDDRSEDSDGDRTQKSTKGLRADEFEPEGGPALREAVDEVSESENSN